MFVVKRYKKNGEEMTPVKVRDGIEIEAHKKKQANTIYYPGTLVPHIHLMEARKYDKFNQLKGGPMPWTKPETIWVNKELLAVEDIYSKLEVAKKNNDTKMIEYLSQPLVTWTCPSRKNKKAIYPQGMIISNRNDKSDYVYKHLERFDNAILKLQDIYKKEYIKSTRGIAALVNLLSAKFCFRVGNCIDKKRTGIGVTTFRPKNIKIDPQRRIHFYFRGKKGVKWHKIFKPENDIEQLMYNGLIELRNKGNEFLFTNDQRISSGMVNELFREVLKVKNNEKEFLSFHSWRHYNASKSFKAELAKLRLSRKFSKILKSKSKADKIIRKARLLNKMVNKVFKKVAKILNDTPGVVKSTYAGGVIFKDFYTQNGIEFDSKRRKANA